MAYIVGKQPIDVRRKEIEQVHYKCPAFRALKDIDDALNWCTRSPDGKLATINQKGYYQSISQECLSLCKDFLVPIPFFNTVTILDGGLRCQLDTIEGMTNETWNVSVRELYFDTSHSIKKVTLLSDDSSQPVQNAFVTHYVFAKIFDARREYQILLTFLLEFKPTKVSCADGIVRCERPFGAFVTFPTTVMPFTHVKQRFHTSQ